MTSFFQPASNDPTILECGLDNFDVYCNKILAADRRLQTWYQTTNLVVGSVALGAPLLVWLFIFATKGGVRGLISRLDRPRRISVGRNKQLLVYDPAPAAAPLALEPAVSSRYDPDSDKQPEPRRYDLAILPLVFSGADGGQDDDRRSRLTLAAPPPPKKRIACLDLELLGSDALGDVQLPLMAEVLARTCSESSLSALALRYTASIHPRQVEKLMQRLQAKELPVLLLFHHDSHAVLDSVSLEHASGVVVENACILPSGQRRDYFQAEGLRDIMAKCAKERERRPDFFVGFLELWQHRPHPSIVRRAVKLAEHFGAAVEHGPSDPPPGSDDLSVSAKRTLSAFEFLKQADLTELQKCWTSELRKVCIPDDKPASKMAPLQLKGIEPVIPHVAKLLDLQYLPPDLAALQKELPTCFEPPEYSDLAPKRKDFWNTSRDGTALSLYGCFSICAEPSAEDYAAVVGTQDHLKELEMLHLVKGAEVFQLLKALRCLAKQEDCRHLIQDLIDGIESHQIVVYKGLDTGFRVPEGDAYFWGVSKTRGNESRLAVDIFLSQKAPNDAAAILHTWLAHKGIPRELRYDLETMLEIFVGGHRSGGDLPVSIKAGIERATPAEVLQLLQQIQVARLDDPLRKPIVGFCRSVLIDQASVCSRRQTYGRKLLDGSMTMRDALTTRLEHFVRCGATYLPTIENLLELHQEVDSAVQDALFFGNKGPLNKFAKTLLHAFDPLPSSSPYKHVDINADLFALIFFSVLRRAAFEEVYVEATDRCPLFLQPDQAAVFSELWVLGSQCESYFGVLPRDLGEVIYDRYGVFLEKQAPLASDRKNNEMMTMYCNAETASQAKDSKGRDKEGSVVRASTMHERLGMWKTRFADFGAMSIFCLPAILDVVLLTFLGRGMFMTAFMHQDHLRAAVYALLTSLLLSAGIVGWVGSTGNYYLANYAYDNMIYFHVQRLSGGFVLSFAVGACGLIAFGLRYSVAVGFIFVAFLIGITTYLNLLGIMATMHQRKSPLTSGRTVVWRNLPLLLLSPLISSFVNGYDLPIYLTAIYCFILLLLFQYRRLCHEWSGWMRNIPDVSEKDVLDWHLATNVSPDDEDEEAQAVGRAAPEVFREAVASYRRGDRQAAASGVMADPFVERVAKGAPYIDWLFQKTAPDGSLPPAFSSGWFSQLSDAKKQQEQLSRGLKEHNILMLFRMARYDIGQNLGLFLVALMDRWVSIVMEARLPHSSMYTNSRSRYGICFCILYFSFSVMVLDVVLQRHWSLRFTASKEPLADLHHARRVAKEWESMRRRALLTALKELLSRIMVIFGAATLLLWLFVESTETVALYYLYVLGYTCVIIFQFNRCFTTSVREHVIVIFVSAVAGFVLGCVLHAVPMTAAWLYSDILAQNLAAVSAAVGTFAWCWWDLSTPKNTMPTQAAGLVGQEGLRFWAQRKLSAEADPVARFSLAKIKKLNGITIRHGDGSSISQMITELLQKSRMKPNTTATETPWATELIDAAIGMWEARRIKAVAVGRESFSRAGLGDMCSVAQIDEGGVMTVKVGHFGDTELHSPSWHPLLATVAAESLLYHVARAEFMQTHAQAVQAEHVLHGTLHLSKRIEMELALGDGSSLKRVMRKTNSELMRHLCWGVDVDSSWESMPHSAREAIFCRISGQVVAIPRELNDWLSDTGVADLHTMDFHLRLCLHVFHVCEERYISTVFYSHEDKLDLVEPAAELKPARIDELRGPRSFLQYLARIPTAAPLTIVKWIAIISGGGANIERELAYSLDKVYLGGLFLRAILLVWRGCRIVKDFWVYTLLVYHRHALVNITRLAQKGERRKMKKGSIVVDLSRKAVTAFATSGGDDNDEGPMTIEAFDGQLKTRPTGQQPVFKASYDEGFRLISRTDDEGTVSTYNHSPQARSRQRWPLSKEMVCAKQQAIGFYDSHGRIKNGILSLGDDGAKVTFSYHYKATPKGSASILRADFTPVRSASKDQLSVFWGQPPSSGADDDCDWVPSDKVCRVVRVMDGRRFVTEFEHRHRRDPVATTMLDEGEGGRTAVAQAPRVSFEDEALLVKPRNLSFDADDVLIHHSTAQVRRMRRWASKRLPLAARWNPLQHWGRRVLLPVPTWRVRTELWSGWLAGKLDAVTVCWMDELILREEPLLRAYWRARESGQLDAARRALDRGIDQIVSAIELESDISELCLLPIRTADLYAMGLAKDATQVTNRPQDCFRDTRDRVSVIFNDIGCWPEAPGGVSNCRRDLVNGHSTIRNHVMAECANDFGIPRFQVEKNVQSLKLLPLWGLDGKTAYHGLMDNMLQSQVDERIRDTHTQRDVVGVFIPLLRDFVKGARTKTYSRADLVKYTNVFLSMSKYYEHKDYNRTWGSKAVEDAWAEAWLTPYHDANITDPAHHFDIQRPSMADFQTVLGIYLAYFFIFAVRIPDECPRVFQSTHHGISSLLGMILKYRRGVTFGIWDHAILWRESCLNISPAQCELSVPVQSMLLAGMRLASRLAYFHADVVMPCTSLFNPMWETDIGTDQGKLCSKNQFRRKIDPIVNGISNMDSFTPVEKVRTDTPTVVMLSNVQFIKGIKPAILAADIIVNRYGFHDYKLLIYGAKDRQPSYALEMAKLIVKCNLSDHVVLAGFGKPKDVLQNAWLFVNSSISEGLPLAIGEAALAGVPIVATEVGATALVVTDPNDQDQRYGEVVAPNDPLALARAQLSLLCMVGPWAKFTEDSEKDDVGELPEDMTPEDVGWLSQRMYDKSDDRRKLGLLSREVVLHSFHGRRYLREHEQMYWIQWHLAQMRADVTLGAGAKNAYKFGALPPLRYTEAETEEEAPGQDEDEDEEQEKKEAVAAAAAAAAAEAAAAAARDAEAERRRWTESPTSTLNPEGQSVHTTDLRSGLARLLLKPSLTRMNRHRHQTEPYSLGGSTAASSFSNWAPG